MAENHLDYRYLDGELMGEHFADDPELLAIKARVQELEMEDYDKLKEEDKCDVEEMQHQTSNSWPGPFYNMTPEERIDADNRSIYVGNVDYGATADELEIHFNGCGPVNRVTILCDRFSGHPKGFAYIEFSDRDSVQSAIGLHETVFRGRVLKHHIKQILHLVHPPFTGWAYEAIISSKIVLVLPKRTNMPGISTTDGGGHRGGQSRGRGRGHHPPRYQNSSRGRYRYQSTRPQHQSPHPYYGGPPAGKRQWGHMDYHEQTPKRNPCLLLITPPSEDLGAVSSGQHYPQQR